MKTPLATAFFFLLAFSATAQRQILCDTCPCLLEKARQYAAADRNSEAISLYQAYLVCEPTKVTYVTAEIKAIQQKTERQKDMERRGKMLEKKLRGEADQQRNIAQARATESRRNARAGHNLAVTLRTLQTDPTLAARMAEMSLREHKDDAVTQQVFADIISNPDNYFYRLQEFEGHRNGIGRQFAVSPDGGYLATFGYDRTVKMWKSDGRLLHTFDSLGLGNVNLYFSNDSFRLLMHDYSQAMVCDTSGEILSRSQLRRDGYALRMQAAISNDGGKWVWHNDNGYLILQNATGQQLDSLNMGANLVNKLVFSPDDTHLLICGSTDTTTLLWDIPHKKRTLLPSQSRIISKGFFSPTGQKVAILDQQGMIQLWNLQGDSLDSYQSKSGSILNAFFANEDSILVQTDYQEVALRLGGSQNVRPFTNLANQELRPFEAGSRVLLLGRTYSNNKSDITVRVYQKDGGYRTRFGISGEDFPVWAGATPDGDIVLYFINRNGSTFKSYSYSNRRAITFPRKGNAKVIGKTDYNTEFSPDGKYFAYTHSFDSAAVVRQTSNPNRNFLRLQKAKCATNVIAINPHLSDTSRYYFLTRNSDSTASLWDIAALEHLTVNDPACRIIQAQFFPDGKHVLLICADSSLSLWNLRDNQRKSIGNYTKSISETAISPDGTTIAMTGRDKRVYLWSVEEQRALAEIQDMEALVKKMYFLPDNHHLLAQTVNGEVFLWDINHAEKPLKAWRGYWNGERIVGWRDMILSPKGSKILLISGGNDAQLTDINDTKTVELNDAFAQSAAFSADETYLLTGGWDNVARLWDEQGRYIASFKGESANGVISVAISPDNIHALTTDGWGATRLWKMPEAFLNDELHHYSPNELVEKDIMPDPDQLDSINHPGALYHAAFNFLAQQDSLTAYKLFDRLLQKFPNQRGKEDVWYYWYSTGKAAGHDHLDSLMRQTRVLYPLAERFKKEGKYAEAKKMYEYLINNGKASVPLWDYFDLCQKGGFQLNKDIFLNDTNATKLAASARYFYSERDFVTARQLYLKSLRIEANADAMIGLDKMKNPDDQPLIQEKAALLTDLYELQRLANHFYTTNGQAERAAALYKQSLRIQEDPQAVIALYEINQKHPEIPFDTTLFEQSSSANTLRQYIWYFEEKGKDYKKIKLWERLFQLGFAEAGDYLDYYLAHKPAEQPAIFDTLLHLESPFLLRELMSNFLGIGETRAERIDSYEKATQLGEQLLKKEDTPEYRSILSQHYSDMGFNCLFAKEYAKSYKAVLRGIELDSENLYLYTNLPHALLFMGEKDKAWEEYKKHAATPFQLGRMPFIRDAYFADFEDFREHFEANPGENFTEQNMKDIDEIERRLRELPANTRKK